LPSGGGYVNRQQIRKETMMRGPQIETGLSHKYVAYIKDTYTYVFMYICCLSVL